MKVIRTEIWAPGGRTRAVADWQWAWHILVQGPSGRCFEQTSGRVYSDRGECEREMRHAIALIEADRPEGLSALHPVWED